MLEKVQRIFGLGYEGKYRKKINSYIAKLPVPPSQIIIFSPRHKPQFNCEVSVCTSDLLEWLKDHCSRRSVSFYHEALLLWLPKADMCDDRALDFPIDLLPAIEEYEEKIVNACKSSIRCGQCGSLFENIEATHENIVSGGNHFSATKVWKCPNGHEIYKNDIGYRFLVRASN